MGGRVNQELDQSKGFHYVVRYSAVSLLDVRYEHVRFDPNGVTCRNSSDPRQWTFFPYYIIFSIDHVQDES